MSNKAKPIHVFSDVRSITRHKLYPKIAILDYWHNKRRTQIELGSILNVEYDCEEMLVTVKSDKIKTFTRRAKAQKET